jgi:hypothetical protein
MNSWNYVRAPLKSSKSSGILYYSPHPSSSPISIIQLVGSRRAIWIGVAGGGRLDRIEQCRRATALYMRVPNDVFECCRIEDCRDRVADLSHQHSHAAGRLVGTTFAAFVRGLAHAGQRRDRSLECAHHFADRELGRRLAQFIATALALLAAQKALHFKLEQDNFEAINAFRAYFDLCDSIYLSIDLID